MRSKENISLDKLKNIINEIVDFNKNVEKDANVAKLNIEYLINREIKIENLEIITKDLGKNDFNIYFKFRSKKELAKYIKKIYIEKNG